MAEKARITKELQDIGACWATTDQKYVLGRSQATIHTKAMYHIHPDASNPHQDEIMSFATLQDIEDWIKMVKDWNEAEDLLDRRRRSDAGVA